MKKNIRLIILIGVVLVFAIALSISKISGTQTAENLSVQAAPNQVGPQVVAQNPVAGQRLDLSPKIQITFDRDMDQGKTGNAFSLLGPDNQPVAGQSTWSGARTFTFTPTSKLEPASTYLGVFSTSATALDGTSPKEAIQMNFTTVEGLKVGQVFPIADAEDVDPTTNITVIFNHPVVPITIQEEQGNLPQPIVAASEGTRTMGQFVGVCVSAGPSSIKRNPLYGPRGSRIERYNWQRVGAFLCFAIHHACAGRFPFCLEEWSTESEVGQCPKCFTGSGFHHYVPSTDEFR
jgi:hypothetical protein